MFNANLDGYAWGGGWYLCLDQVCKLWRMTWEPPWGYESIGVIAHETGHGFGLPHSEGNCQGVYDNRWDVMSDVWSNGSDPVYGTMGQHTISYHKEYLGWLTPGQVFSATSGTLATITLEKLALPQTNNFLEAVIPINGSLSHFYTLEVRQPTADPIDYDKWLPGFAVIIHEVTEGQSEPAILVDQDGDCNTGDAGAMFTVGEVFTDILHGITVKIESATPSGYVVTINNRFKPLQGVTIGGLDQGNIGESLPFTATVSPVDASTPITYTWEASSQTPVQHVGGAIDPVSFTWDEVGTKAITVTASNAGGEVVNTHFVTIEDGSSLAGVEISGPGVGYVHDSYTFTAYIQPISISLPITYTWSIDADTPITHSAGISDTLSFSWDEPGMHAIHVTASNPLSSVTDTWEVVIYGKVFLALCTKG